MMTIFGVAAYCGSAQAAGHPNTAGWDDLFAPDLSNIQGSSNWSMVGGVLVAADSRTLWTAKSYTNFILDLEFKVESLTANSGVFLRSGNITQTLNAVEVQVHGSADTSKYGMVGAIYDCKPPSKLMQKPIGEWNHFTITCDESLISLVFNGQEVIRINLDDWKEVGKNPDGTTNKFPAALKDFARRGPIGLQGLIGAGEPVWYRNLKIKETPILPYVKTLPATNVMLTTATLNGSVNARSNARNVTFEYGTTVSYGTELAATPGTLSNSVETPVSLAVTGLLPHTLYHYRAKASGVAGTAVGPDNTLITANSVPVANPDGFAVLPGGKVTLNVFANDLDADGDALTIATVGAVTPKAAGALAKSGNSLVFTPAPSFSGPATFTYTVKDAFGGVSGPATVTLTAGSGGLDPEAKEVPSAAGRYDVNVTATGLWSAVESLPWVTVNPLNGDGSGTVEVTLSPNAAKKARSGVIVIGGVTHTVTQLGVVMPKIDAPGTVPAAIVGAPFSVEIPTEEAPVTYAVTQMPPGLKVNHATGRIEGVPTKGGTFHVGVKASNAAGSTGVVNFDIAVQPIPEGAVGVFHGFVKADDVLNGGLGSRFELTTTALGAYSGKIISGVTAVAIKGQLTTLPLDADHPELTLSIPRKNSTPLLLTLTFDAPNNNLDGDLSDQDTHTAEVAAWRNAWNATTRKATAYAIAHTFSLEQPDQGSDLLPQGYGYGAFTAKDTTGALTVAGKLADGSAFTNATFVGMQGQVLVYQSLYGNKGCLAGVLKANAAPARADNTVEVAAGYHLDWLKPGPVPNSKDTVYKSGFGPVHLTVEGAVYTPPAKGAIVMELPAPASNDNAKLEFESGGLPAKLEITFGILNPSATGLTNKVIMPTFAGGGNPQKINLPILTPATGLFGGDFTLAGETAAKNRKVTFQGQMVRHISGGIRGYGFFLMPELPDSTGETLANTPKHSGRVILRAAP